jgi:hypothetical protein
MLLALTVCSQFQLAVDRALLEVINRSVLGLKLTSHGDEICHRYMQDGFYRERRYALHPIAPKSTCGQDTLLDDVTPAAAKPCFLQLAALGHRRRV